MRYIDQDGNTVYVGSLEENKSEALQLITQNFLSLGKTNFILFNGIEVDNRWIEKNDLQNYELSYSFYQKSPEEQILLRDRNNLFHFIKINDLKNIIQICIEDRLKKMTKKWEFETSIFQSESIVDIWSIVDEAKNFTARG